MFPQKKLRNQNLIESSKFNISASLNNPEKFEYSKFAYGYNFSKETAVLFFLLAWAIKYKSSLICWDTLQIEDEQNKFDQVPYQEPGSSKSLPAITYYWFWPRRYWHWVDIMRTILCNVGLSWIGQVLLTSYSLLRPRNSWSHQELIGLNQEFTG